MGHEHPGRLSPVNFVTLDPDAVLDAVALVRAHADRDGQAAAVVLSGCCGRCTANLLAYLVAASAEHPESLHNLFTWRDQALYGGAE